MFKILSHFYARVRLILQFLAILRVRLVVIIFSHFYICDSFTPFLVMFLSTSYFTLFLAMFTSAIQLHHSSHFHKRDPFVPFLAIFAFGTHLYHF